MAGRVECDRATWDGDHDNDGRRCDIVLVSTGNSVYNWSAVRESPGPLNLRRPRGSIGRMSARAYSATMTARSDNCNTVTGRNPRALEWIPAAPGPRARLPESGWRRLRNCHVPRARQSSDAVRPAHRRLEILGGEASNERHARRARHSRHAPVKLVAIEPIEARSRRSQGWLPTRAKLSPASASGSRMRGHTQHRRLGQRHR